MIQRETDARNINAVLNHPQVRPWVANSDAGQLDVTPLVQNPKNFLLMGQYGGCFFVEIVPGVYEVHTQVLPLGHGEWTRDMTLECVKWMFTRTPAFEIVTRVPQGHIAAKTAAQQVGMRYEFSRSNECRFRGHMVDVRIYSMRLQDWVPTAQSFIPVGQKFHHRLHEEADRLGIKSEAHEDDENHNLYVGVCVEMIRHGQVAKAVNVYNRWAIVSRHAPVVLVGMNPVTVKMDIGYLTFLDNDIRVTLP